MDRAASTGFSGSILERLQLVFDAVAKEDFLKEMRQRTQKR